MPSVSKSVELTGSQEDAFALATDPARFEEWLTIHDRWPDGVPGAPEQGASFRQGIKIMGMPADVAWTIETLEPGAKMVLKGAGPMGAQLATIISADGPTVSYEAEFSGGGIQGPMGDMVTQKAGEEIEASLAKLKALQG
jgi:acetyl-CoA C-acetyltransferase